MTDLRAKTSKNDRKIVAAKDCEAACDFPEQAAPETEVLNAARLTMLRIRNI